MTLEEVKKRITIENGYIWFNGISEFGIKPSAFSYNEKFNKEKGKWECFDRIRLGWAEKPVGYCLSPNMTDRYLATICKKIGAPIIYQRLDTDVYDENPYGRKVARWKADYYIFDLRKFVDCNKELSEFLDFETKCMVENYLERIGK